MYTVYQTRLEGKELPESQWVIVVGEIDYRTGGTKRSPHLIANVFDKDFKPLLGDLEHAVVIDVGNGRFAIQGQQKAIHEKGMYWDKRWYLQVWGCVPVTDKLTPHTEPIKMKSTTGDLANRRQMRMGNPNR